MGARPKKKLPTAYWVALVLGCVSMLLYIPRIVASVASDGGPHGLIMGLAIALALTGLVFGAFSWWIGTMIAFAKRSYAQGYVMHFGMVPELAPAIRAVDDSVRARGGLSLLMVLVADQDRLLLLKGLRLKTAASIPLARIRSVHIGETTSNHRPIACVSVEVATDTGLVTMPFVPSGGARWWKTLKSQELSAVLAVLTRNVTSPAEARED